MNHPTHIQKISRSDEVEIFITPHQEVVLSLGASTVTLNMALAVDLLYQLAGSISNQKSARSLDS